MSDLLQEALEYVRRGWWIFPCREKEVCHLQIKTES